MIHAHVDITPAQLRQYDNDGYFVLPSVIPAPHLQLLREEGDSFIAAADAEMTAKNVDKLNGNFKGSRYFEAFAHDRAPRIKQFLFSDLMADICRAVLGGDAFLYWEQYVIKGPERGLKFSWHQDSGYGMHAVEKPYLSCWCALDDMSEANGTVYLLPYSRGGGKKVMPHVRDPELNDLVGYHGDDPGDPVLCPAGSIACFSSFCFHRSGFNTSPNFRRVFLAQYTAAPIMKRDGTGVAGRAIPFLKNGSPVTQD
jgi:ectoine hydroxylase-related dioxygenase (phytanoyl-CoA dioxygenase family)